MSKLRKSIKLVGSTLVTVSLFGLNAQACTTLITKAADGSVYHGRTLEFATELPWQITYFPSRTPFTSSAPPGMLEVKFQSNYRFLAITVPVSNLQDLKVLEGINEHGLTFSALMFFNASGPKIRTKQIQSVLSAADLGFWGLSQFKTVAQVKAALEQQPVWLEKIKLLNNLKTPLHFVFFDRTGAGIVVEYFKGKQTIYDNAPNVMTNGPEFSWHLTNLNNYSYLNNLDRSQGIFGTLKVQQPDSGIALEGLPSSNTSVGRFVRAAYYSQYVEKAKDPDEAIYALGHVMNNFDRPKEITIDTLGASANEGVAINNSKDFSSEYTSWTTMEDLNRNLLFIRTYKSINYTLFDLNKLKNITEVKSIPLTSIDGPISGQNQLLTR